MKKIIIILIFINSIFADISPQEYKKMLPNHQAYNYYKMSKYAFEKENYIVAYKYAIKAKSLYNNKNSRSIKLPYLPDFLRESAFAPKRILYQFMDVKGYEVDRLIKKIKLLAPPVAFVTINRTGSSFIIMVKNMGKLPLDQFGVLINKKYNHMFNQIKPDESSSYTLNIDLSTNSLDSILFSEEHGFVPKEIEFSKEEEENSDEEDE